MDLIIYGLGNKYQAKKFKPIQNRDFVKPHGGLWTSPTKSKYGWWDWCKAEDWGDLSTSFTIHFEGRIFKVDSLEDAKRLPWRTTKFNSLVPDFEQIAENYDAIHLTVKGQNATRFSRPHSLYGWDCECVLILRPDGIRA